MTKKAKYAALAEKLENDIAAGMYKVGDKFPSERVLVKRSGLSLLTVRQAFSTLERKGLIIRRQGAGSFVTALKPQQEKVWIAVIVMDFNSEVAAGYQFIYAAWMRGLSEAMEEIGALITIMDMGIVKDPPERLREVAEQEKGPAGYVFSTVHHWMLDWLTGAAKRPPLPHVVIADRPVDRRLNVVTVDFEGASREMVRKFRGLGHERMAFVGTEGCNRWDGWVAGLKEHGLYERNRDMLIADPERTSVLIVAEENGYRVAREFLKHPDRPTAVYCMNDSRAKGVLRAAEELGISVPRELSIVGFDDMPGIDRLSTPLATFAPDWEAVGREAGKALITWIRKGAGYAPRCRVREIQLVERTSLGSAPGRAAAAGG
ncbi:MAG TPA: GntR family transcriptional regulator [Planctomycetes bacterium]|nr:GntR family transcriptional regulator [Planctomycetota bacterium]